MLKYSRGRALSTTRVKPPPSKMPRSLAANVRRGAIWSLLGTVAWRLSAIGITAIVAHILTPHDFGVFAVATIVFTIVSALGEFGVTSCLARADLDADKLAPTLWSVTLVTSSLIAILLYEFASPISASLGSRDAKDPVRVMALVMLIWGLGAVPTAQCIREFKQHTLFWANAISFIPGNAVLLILARHGDGAMAYAWSRVAGQAVSCAVVIYSAPKLHMPGVSRYAFKILFKVGLPLACANFLGYVLQNVDYALIGHLIGPVSLGAYVLAFNVASWSMTVLGNVLNTVSMPAFSRVRNDIAKLRSAVTDSVRLVTLIAAPMCTMTIALARPLVLTIYGSKWSSSAEVLSILTIYGFISVLGVMISNVLAAVGRSKTVLLVQLLWLAALAPAMWLGVRQDGIVGAATAHIAIIAPVVLPCYLISLKHSTGVKIADLVKAAMPSLAVATIMAFLAWCAETLTEGPLTKLVVGSATGGLLYAMVMFPRLVSLMTRGRALPSGLEKTMIKYNRVGRTLGLPTGAAPRHAIVRPRRQALRGRSQLRSD